MHPFATKQLRVALDPLLRNAGFAFENGGRFRGSGGDFAEAAYVRGRRRLELWWRGDVLAVHYVDGEARLEHSVYTSLLGARAERRFPCTGDLTQQLEALAADLASFGRGFLDPASDEIRRLAVEHARDPDRFRGLRGLATDEEAAASEGPSRRSPLESTERHAQGISSANARPQPGVVERKPVVLAALGMVAIGIVVEIVVLLLLGCVFEQHEPSAALDLVAAMHGGWLGACLRALVMLAFAGGVAWSAPALAHAFATGPVLGLATWTVGLVFDSAWCGSASAFWVMLLMGGLPALFVGATMPLLLRSLTRRSAMARGRSRVRFGDE